MLKNNKKRVRNVGIDKIVEETPTGPDLPKISITDAVVVAVLPVFAYVLHYFFEYGYLSYFDLPAAFISFNLNEIIPAIFFLVVTYIIFVLVLWPFVGYLSQVVPDLIKPILLILPWIIISIFLGLSWGTILLISLFILLISGFELYKKYRARRQASLKSGLSYQPEHQQKIASFESKNSFSPIIQPLIPRGSWVLLFYLFILVLAGSTAFGRIAAMTRTNFLITETSPRCAVVYTTSERYICKPLNDNNQFGNSFKIFYFKKSQSEEFRNEYIGPLRPNPTVIVMEVLRNTGRCVEIVCQGT